jgi:hypothetical protein
VIWNNSGIILRLSFHYRGENMRSLKYVLVLLGVAQLALAVGFFFSQPWATGLWPVPDTPLSYSFIAAILAGGAAPLIWIGLSDRAAALAGYGFSFFIMYAGMALAALWFFVRDRNPAFTWFSLLLGLLAIFCGSLFLRTRYTRSDRAPTPRLVRMAFIAEVLVLAGVGILLLIKVPNTLPWNISPESSVLYGWVFLGLAFYYIYALVRPQWIHALGPLLGFLVYDIVLAYPLFAHYASLQPGQLLGQIAASFIIIVSAILGIYYLFVNPGTRLGSSSERNSK